MRLPHLALVLVLAALAFGIAGATVSQDPGLQQVAANHGAALRLPGLNPAAPKFMTVLSDQAPIAFCGQCSSDSDCGSGHKCCGPSNCRECFQVDTCQ